MHIDENLLSLMFPSPPLPRCPLRELFRIPWTSKNTTEHQLIYWYQINKQQIAQQARGIVGMLGPDSGKCLLNYSSPMIADPLCERWKHMHF